MQMWAHVMDNCSASHRCAQWPTVNNKLTQRCTQQQQAAQSDLNTLHSTLLAVTVKLD